VRLGGIISGGCAYIFRSGGAGLFFGDGVGGPNGFYSFSRFLLISCGQDRMSHGFVGGGGRDFVGG
jgi:hypothetical protein